MKSSLHQRMRRLVLALTLSMGVTFGASMTAPLAANAEPAGQYYYQCIGTNGSSYWLQRGARLDSCKGSYIKTYINGVNIRTIKLTGYGTPATATRKDLNCFLAIVGAGSVVIATDGTALWVVDALLAAYGLSACRA